MVQVLRPRLHLLEGAEGSEVIISLKQGGEACLKAICLRSPHCRSLLSSFSLPSSKQNYWRETTMGIGGGTFLPLVLLQNAHFDSNSWHEGSGWTCRLPQSPTTYFGEHRATQSSSGLAEMPHICRGSLRREL